MQSVSDVDSLLFTGSVDRHSSLRALSALSDWLVSESAPGRHNGHHMIYNVENKDGQR